MKAPRKRWQKKRHVEFLRKKISIKLRQLFSQANLVLVAILNLAAILNFFLAPNFFFFFLVCFKEYAKTFAF
jgi:hypothetical protein